MIANITAPSLTELHKLKAQIPSLKIMEVTRQREGLNILVRHVADNLSLHIHTTPH